MAMTDLEMDLLLARAEIRKLKEKLRQDRRHGRWIDGQCSVCKQFDSAHPFGSRYCPNCGARMDGEADG